MCADCLNLPKSFLPMSTSLLKTYKEKFKAVNTPVKTLKDCNWDVVEYQTLLQDAQAIKSTCEKGINELAVCCDERKFKSCKAMLKDNASNIKAYTRNLFKKKWAAATQVDDLGKILSRSYQDLTMILQRSCHDLAMILP